MSHSLGKNLMGQNLRGIFTGVLTIGVHSEFFLTRHQFGTDLVGGTVDIPVFGFTGVCIKGGLATIDQIGLGGLAAIQRVGTRHFQMDGLDLRRVDCCDPTAERSHG